MADAPTDVSEASTPADAPIDVSEATTPADEAVTESALPIELLAACYLADVVSGLVHLHLDYSIGDDEEGEGAKPRRRRSHFHPLLGGARPPRRNERDRQRALRE